MVSLPDHTSIILKRLVKTYAFLFPLTHVLWKGKKSIALKELTDKPLLRREKDSPTRMLLHSFLTEQKIDWCEGIEAGRNESAKRGVIVGLGISFIPTNTITASVEKGRLEVLDLASTSLDRHWYLMRLQKKLILASLFLEISWNNLLELHPGALKKPP